MTKTNLLPEAVQALATDLRLGIPYLHVHGMSVDHLVAAADALDQFAARLAQEAGSCETCQFAHTEDAGMNIYWECLHPRVGDCLVPVTLNGQPFGCRGWQAKPAPPDGDRATET